MNLVLEENTSRIFESHFNCRTNVNEFKKQINAYRDLFSSLGLSRYTINRMAAGIWTLQ